MGHASMLIFPSRGPESLSRVLIEASALGVPIAAMRTGGTPDIVVDEQTGLLSATPEELAEDIRRLRGDAELRARLGSAARLHAEDRFDAPAVVERVERLYFDLTKRPR
jgi:glycosyltransferase involved in cell wall biosynthesis